MAKPLPQVNLTDDEKETLNRIVIKRTSPQGLVRRAQIVLLANEMKSTDEISQLLSINRKTVILWRRKFIEKRIDGLKDEPRSGRKPIYKKNVVAKIISKTLEPPENMAISEFLNLQLVHNHL